MTLIISLNWIDLNKTLKSYIIYKMLNSFKKNDYTSLNIDERFSKKKCVVDLYYENEKLEGVCIFWKINKFIYLDKFFSINFKNGVGSRMLNLFIDKYKSNNIIWRTNEELVYFYLKNKFITKLFNYRSTCDKDYVFMGIKKILYWEYEDLHNLNIKSCFE